MAHTTNILTIFKAVVNAESSSTFEVSTFSKETLDAQLVNSSLFLWLGRCWGSETSGKAEGVLGLRGGKDLCLPSLPSRPLDVFLSYLVLHSFLYPSTFFWKKYTRMSEKQEGNFWSKMSAKGGSSWVHGETGGHASSARLYYCVRNYWLISPWAFLELLLHIYECAKWCEKY